MELITMRMKLTEKLAKKEINTLASKFGISGKNTDLELIRKGTTPFDIGDVQFEANERSVIKTITTVAKDRDDEIILPDGIILDHYNKQPVVLPGHNYSGLGVGKSIWIKSIKDGYGLMQKTQYAKTQLAEEYWKWQKDGFPMAASIGFIPIKSFKNGEQGFNEISKSLIDKGWIDSETIKSTKRIYTKVLLLEVSDVLVPSNQEAVTVAVSKGLLPDANSVIHFSEEEEKQIKLVMKNINKGDVDGDTASGTDVGGGNGVGSSNDDNRLIIEKQEDELLNAVIDNTVKGYALIEKSKIIVWQYGNDEGKSKRLQIQDSPLLYATVEDNELCELQFPTDKGWTKEKAIDWIVKHDVDDIDFGTLSLLHKWSGEDNTILKTIDAEGNPSVHEIIESIRKMINASNYKNNDMVTASENDMAYVTDLYPIDYPNGHVIVTMYIENNDGSPSIERHIDFKYIYETTIETVTLFDPIQVEEQWVQIKKLNEKFLKAMEERSIEKEGRVLSKKNTKLIQEAVSALSSLLVAVEPPPSKGISENKLVMNVKEFETKFENKKEKKELEALINPTKLKEAMGEIIEERLKQSRDELSRDLKNQIALKMGKAVIE